MDECYSATDRSHKFTLVRFEKKTRKSAVKKFMSYASNKYGIVSSEIVGYDGITANNTSNELYMHVGFQILIQFKTNMNPLFSFWIKSPDLRGGGILETYLRNDRPINRDGINGGGGVLMFDVVKKRKAMEAAPAEEESVPEALAVFEEFEASVLTALENIREDEAEFRRQENLELEESLSRGVIPPPTGGVYFAWSPCLMCMKIGATRKEDPLIRLRQLSRYVTSPFVLSAWLPTPMPFRLEAAAHLHFKRQRMNSRGCGAGTEFFTVTAAEAGAYVGGV